eukprot:379383-Rhodomonas_salina.1
MYSIVHCGMYRPTPPPSRRFQAASSQVGADIMLKRRPYRPRWLPLLLLSLCIVDTASDFENAGNARSKETM